MKKVFFVASAGGHLSQILRLKSLIEINESYLITEKSSAYSTFDNVDKLIFMQPAGKGRDLTYFVNFFFNIVRSFFLILKYKPDYIISTGSHTAVPYFIWAYLFRIKSIFILSYARIRTTSKSADLIYKLADEFIVQWKESKENYPNAKYLGGGLF